MQEELDGLASNYPDRFKVYYVLNQVSFFIIQLVSKLFIFPLLVKIEFTRMVLKSFKLIFKVFFFKSCVIATNT